MESFIPTILEKGSDDALGTMLVQLHKCPLCEKWMVYNPRDQFSIHTMFPHYYKISFEDQLKQAGWVLASTIEVEDHAICSVCLKSGKAYFVCGLCQEKRPTSDIQEQFGDPPEFLCGSCYQTTPASQWDAKTSELQDSHRWDFE